MRFLFPMVLVATAALADPIQVQFTGVNGTAAFGYYVGPYTGQIKYGNFESQTVSLYCDDFANEVTWNQTWEANVSTITAGSNLSNTRYGGVANALQLYQEIAWLDTQFGVQPTSQYGDIHATIWDLFDPAGAPLPSSDKWLKLAEQNYGTIAYNDFAVLTNVGPVTATGQVQEFLTILPSSTISTMATPEPQTGLLIGFGLLATGTFWRLLGGKKKSRAG